MLSALGAVPFHAVVLRAVPEPLDAHVDVEGAAVGPGDLDLRARSGRSGQSCQRSRMIPSGGDWVLPSTRGARSRRFVTQRYPR